MRSPRRLDDRTVTRTETSYLAAPAGRPRAVIAVLHAWWGLTPVITGVCDDLADLGYVAVAPDLYRGDVAATAEEAGALRARKRSTPMWRQIVSEIDRARSQFDVAPVGQIGFSMGGHWALWLAKQSRPEIPPITATSVFYATRAGDFAASCSAFQFHLAETDPFVTEAGVARQERQLRSAGRPVELSPLPRHRALVLRMGPPRRLRPRSCEPRLAPYSRVPRPPLPSPCPRPNSAS